MVLAIEEDASTGGVAVPGVEAGDAVDAAPAAFAAGRKGSFSVNSGSGWAVQLSSGDCVMVSSGVVAILTLLMLSDWALLRPGDSSDLIALLGVRGPDMASGPAATSFTACRCCHRSRAHARALATFRGPVLIFC